MRQGVRAAYTKAVSSRVLVCVTLIAGALFGMGAQSGLLHLGLDFGSVRDEFPQAKVAGAVGVIASLSAVGAGLVRMITTYLGAAGCMGAALEA